MKVANAQKGLQAARDELVKAQPPQKVQKLGEVSQKRSEKDTLWKKRAAGWAIAVFLVPAAVTMIIAAATHGKGAWSETRFALFWAAGVTTVIFVVLGFVYPGFNRGGTVAYVVGKDNRLSTSKMQVGLWTVAIVFGFLFLTFQLARIQDASKITQSVGKFGPEYLLLLGGPFAAAVVSKAATTTKTQDGTVQQVDAAAPSAGDLVSDHDGQTSITDAQFFAFNLVALTYFAVAFARTPTALPSLPATLVGLTSVSALTYMGNKIVASNQAVVRSVSIVSSPSNGRLHAGDLVRITGANFCPPGTAPEDREKMRVLFDSVEATPEDGASDTEIQVRVPEGLADHAGAAVSVKVRTAAGIETDPYTGLTAEGPVISFVRRDNAALEIHGYGLRSLDGAPTVRAVDATGASLALNPMSDDQKATLRLRGILGVDLAAVPAHPPATVRVLVNGAATQDVSTLS